MNKWRLAKEVAITLFYIGKHVARKIKNRNKYKVPKKKP